MTPQPKQSRTRRSMPDRSKPKRVGRPRTFDADEALDTVLDLFWRQGFRGTTTRVLEAELGLGPSSLYNAFGSKEEMLEAALDRYQDRLDSEVLSHLTDEDGGLETIDRFLAALGRWVSGDSRGCLMINLMAESGSSPEVLARARRYRIRVREALKRALRRAANAGEIDAEGLESHADLLVTSILGLDVAAHGGASAAELRRLLSATRSQVQAWSTG